MIKLVWRLSGCPMTEEGIPLSCFCWSLLESLLWFCAGEPVYFYSSHLKNLDLKSAVFCSFIFRVTWSLHGCANCIHMGPTQMGLQVIEIHERKIKLSYSTPITNQIMPEKCWEPREHHKHLRNTFRHSTFFLSCIFSICKAFLFPSLCHYWLFLSHVKN